MQPDLTQDFLIHDEYRDESSRDKRSKVNRQRLKFKGMYTRRMTLWAIGIQTTSIPLKRSLLMIVLGHRYHQSKEYWNQHSVFLHKLMWTPILHNNKKFQYLQHQRARMLDRQYPSHLFRRPLCQLKVSDYWGSKKKEAELITNYHMTSTDRIEKLENQLPSEVSI